MLEIKNFNISLTEDTGIEKEIIKDLNLEIKKDEITLIMGPNGAGKSTLAKGVMNWPTLGIDGDVVMDKENISDLEIDERAKKGIFYGHQSPVEVPGVHLVEFIRNAHNLMHEDEHMDPWTFKEMFEALADSLGLSPSFSKRNLNEGFSGGEKKKAEVLQMLLIRPKYAILDEIDSGLDIDSLKLIFNAVETFAKEEKAGVMIISHNPNILEYLTPDKVHVLKDGELYKSGDRELAEEVVKLGFNKI